MPSLLRSASLTNYVTVAREVGLDPHIELRRAGISAAALLDPDIRLPAEPVMRGLRRHRAHERSLVNVPLPTRRGCWASLR